MFHLEEEEGEEEAEAEAEAEALDEREAGASSLTAERAAMLDGSVVKWDTGLEIVMPQGQKNGTADKEHCGHHLITCPWTDHFETGINFHKDHD